MARLQILELPAGSGDDRPPFVLVIDQCEGLPLDTVKTVEGYWRQTGEQIGARGVLIFMESVEIPANDPLPVAGGVSDSRRRCGEHDGPCFPEPAAKCVAHGDEECLYCHRNPSDCANGGNCSTWARTGMHWDTCANRVRGSLAVEDPERAGTAQIVYAHEQTRLDLCSALLLDSGTPWRKLVELVAERQREVAGSYQRLDELSKALGMVGPQKWDDIRHAVADLRQDRDEARSWARHGYEIGQRHCGWSDHGVAPEWLTKGWPPHFDSCEHLKQAAEYDDALTRVRGLPTAPDVMNAQQERPDIWRHGYECGVLAAKSAARPRNERATTAEDGA